MGHRLVRHASSLSWSSQKMSKKFSDILMQLVMSVAHAKLMQPMNHTMSFQCSKRVQLSGFPPELIHMLHRFIWCAWEHSKTGPQLSRHTKGTDIMISIRRQTSSLILKTMYNSIVDYSSSHLSLAHLSPDWVFTSASVLESVWIPRKSTCSDFDCWKRWFVPIFITSFEMAKQLKFSRGQYAKIGTTADIPAFIYMSEYSLMKWHWLMNHHLCSGGVSQPENSSTAAAVRIAKPGSFLRQWLSTLQHWLSTRTTSRLFSTGVSPMTRCVSCAARYCQII